MAVNSFREDEKINATDAKKITVRLMSYLKDYIWQIIVVFIAMTLTIGISILNPLLIEKAVDVYVANKDMEGLMRLGLFAAAINIAFVFLVKLRMYVMSYISNKIILRIRDEVYEHIQTLSFTYFDSRPTGKILARIMGDVNSLRDVFSRAVTSLIPNILTVITVLVIMLAKNWKLALASLAMLPFMVVAAFWVQKTNHSRWQVHRKKVSNLSAYTHENIAGMRVVQSLNAVI